MKRRRSEKQRHVVPWLNKAEWDQVREYLYSKDVALQRFAVDRISAWKARDDDNVQVAVDCAADLVRCQIQDRSRQLNDDELVLLYGAALVRFVNLITERQQGRIVQPLKHLAWKLNIPEWVIELRHDFTHRKRPPLNLIRKGCEVLMEWLQREYWSRQFGGGPDESWDSQSDEKADQNRRKDAQSSRQKEIDAYKSVRELLISYEKEQFRSLDRLHEDKEMSLCQAPLADMSWLLGEIKQFALDSSELLMDVLLEDGFLVPTREQLEILSCDPSESSSPTEPRLPQIFLRFWLPLLKMLNCSSFVHLFLEKLFVELRLLTNEQDSERLFYISAWISEVLLCNSNKSEYRFETKVQKKARVKDRIFVNRIQLHWQQLLSACLDAPCISTPHLVQLILDDMEHPLPLDTRQKLLQLCSIYTQTTHTQRSPSQDYRQQPFYTVESLIEKQSQLRRTTASSDRSESSQELKWADDLAEKAKLLRGSPWQVCTDEVQWENYPLGKVPGQSDDPSSLMIETYIVMTVLDQPVELDSSSETQNVPGVSAPSRTAEGRWSQDYVNKLKSGLKLF